VLASGNILMSCASHLPYNTGYPYTGGSNVFPYAYNTANGQLTSTGNTDSIGPNTGREPPL
jgi:hypothetical protein